jgi:hypothetical protein
MFQMGLGTIAAATDRKQLDGKITSGGLTFLTVLNHIQSLLDSNVPWWQANRAPHMNFYIYF